MQGPLSIYKIGHTHGRYCCTLPSFCTISYPFLDIVFCNSVEGLLLLASLPLTWVGLMSVATPRLQSWYNSECHFHSDLSNSVQGPLIRLFQVIV